jgi:hypothetical protein
MSRHELHVELQVARVEVGDLLEARVAGSDVVDGDREPDLGEVLQRLHEQGVVLDRVLLTPRGRKMYAWWSRAAPMAWRTFG